jgi:hypothetical protein
LSSAAHQLVRDNIVVHDLSHRLHLLVVSKIVTAQGVHEDFSWRAMLRRTENSPYAQSGASRKPAKMVLKAWNFSVMALILSSHASLDDYALLWRF